MPWYLTMLVPLEYHRGFAVSMSLIAILCYFTERFPGLWHFFESIYSFLTLADGKMPIGISPAPIWRPAPIACGGYHHARTVTEQKFLYNVVCKILYSIFKHSVFSCTANISNRGNEHYEKPYFTLKTNIFRHSILITHDYFYKIDSERRQALPHFLS